MNESRNFITIAGRKPAPKLLRLYQAFWTARFGLASWVAGFSVVPADQKHQWFNCSICSRFTKVECKNKENHVE